MRDRLRRPLRAISVAARVREPAPQHVVLTGHDVAAAGGATLRPLYDEQTIEPDEASGFFPPEEANLRFPGAYVLSLPHGRAVRHGIVTATGALVGDLSLEAGFSPESVDRHSILTAGSVPRAKRIRGRAVAVNGTYSRNYYHWMLEVVPRLALVLEHSPEDRKATPLILETLLEDFQRETLEHMGVRPERVVTSIAGAYHADELVVPASAGRMIHPPPWAVMMARRAVGALSGPDRPPSRKLYVQRGSGARRSVHNERDLLDVLAQRGFVAVDPAGMSVREQARLFASATCVVGAHGAALTNLLFCAEGTKVVELLPHEVRTPCYYLLATHLGLDYAPVAGERDGLQGLAAMEADFDVDVDMVLAALGT